MFETSKQGAITVLVASAPLTADHVADAAAAMEECFRHGTPMAVLDMSEIPLVDSAGLELLLNAHDGFAARGGGFKVAAANELCRDIMAVTGVADEIELFDEVRLAVRSFLK